MKYRTRAKIAIAGLGLFCATALFGATYRIIEINKPTSVESPHPVNYTIQCEPIEEPEPAIVHMDTEVIEIEPQIEESNLEIEIEYYESPIKLTEDEWWVVQCMVAGEAGWEPYEGKKAVAQCIFDAMLKDGISAREVRDKYQYAGWNDQLEYQSREMYIECMDAVTDIFVSGKFVTEKPILFFYNPALCRSDWHEAQEFEMKVGGHRFFYLAEDENAEWANILLTKVNEYGIIENED